MIFKAKRKKTEILLYADEARKIMRDMGYDVSRVKKEVEIKKINALGRCSKIICRGCREAVVPDYDFWITVTDEFLDRAVPPDWIIAVILHEYIHTVPGCFTHSEKFCEICDVIREKYGYDPTPGLFRKTIKLAKKPGVRLFCPKCGRGLDIRGESAVKQIIEAETELVCDICGKRFAYDEAKCENIEPYTKSIFRQEHI